VAGLYFQGFVCDEDSQHLQAQMGRYGRLVVPLSRIGITVGRGTPDWAVVQHARGAGRIVITGNRSDFAREMDKAAERCVPGHCFEGGGMVSVASGISSLPFVRISRTMTFNGLSVLWEDVYMCNLHVAVYRDETFSVRSLPVCDIFKRITWQNARDAKHWEYDLRFQGAEPAR
jgi:hypothetical protein